MIVNVVPASAIDSFDYFIYPEQNPINQGYFYQQVYNINQAINAFGQKFFDTSREIFEKINDSAAIKAAKAALRYAVGLSHPNAIVELKTTEEIRAAQPVMQRYIMASPYIRQLYNEQKIDGYADTYFDSEPGKIGSKHYDYRRVMDSIVQDNEDEQGQYEWISQNFYEDLLPGDRDLEFEEKVKILSTWQIIESFMRATQEDLTNPFGGQMG